MRASIVVHVVGTGKGLAFWPATATAELGRTDD
jgi:hypothetical protein